MNNNFLDGVDPSNESCVNDMANPTSDFDSDDEMLEPAVGLCERFLPIPHTKKPGGKQ